jgi:hypothetical protein
MSLFESVWVKLACERCGKIQETVVRFHSYSGRPDAEYELMEVVPQGVGLSRGDVWEGNADRYCRKCEFAWSIAQATAAYEALAELIEAGRVTARAKGSLEPLPATAINAYAQEYVRELRKQGGIMATMPYFEELDLTVGDKPVTIGGELSDENDSTWTEFLTLIDPLLSDRMQKAGWVADGSTWEDFNVSLDHDRRIVVEDLQGRRLSRDGTRNDGGRATQ